MPDTLESELRKQLLEIIRANATPLEPQPTGVAPRLKLLPDVRAVLFDVYGTLLISGSGDVGTTEVDSRPAAFGEALAAAGIDWSGDNDAGVRQIAKVIAAHHERERRAGIEHPEVEIREVWSDVLDQLGVDGSEKSSTRELTRLALEYEVRTNPTCAMPHARLVLGRLRTDEIVLGIVSNAQVFTPLLFEPLLGDTLERLGFDESLCEWSYRHRQAKPGTFLYEHVRKTLMNRGLEARHVLFVGNDRLKDVWPAHRVGFRTALFAGDARSYRPRAEDPRLMTLEPDLVLTDLAQLPECVIPQ